MREAAFIVGFNLAVACSLARAAGVLLGAAKSVLTRHRFRVVRFGVVEAVTLLEPAVLAVAAYVLLINRRATDSVSVGGATAALAGGLIALWGLILILWTFTSWRQLFVGHAVLADQKLVTEGAYGMVRHPVYLAALLIWCGLSLCFLSPEVAVITALYVLPAYLLYIRSEEAMMLDSFGSEYRSYRRQVPMLLPRPPRALL